MRRGLAVQAAALQAAGEVAGEAVLLDSEHLILPTVLRSGGDVFTWAACTWHASKALQHYGFSQKEGCPCFTWVPAQEGTNQDEHKEKTPL